MERVQPAHYILVFCMHKQILWLTLLPKERFRVIINAPYYVEQQLLYERQGRQGARSERDAVLTIYNDLDYPEVNFSSGHDTSLTGVHALIYLLDAADLQVAIIHDLESH